MSVNKNFVVKNGLEVNTNLILADANTNKVGIGSTAPRFELDVAGGIGATNFYLSGIGTVLNELNVGTNGSVLTVLGVGGSVGVGTAIPRYLLDIRSPVSTGQTALYVQGDVKITGDLSVDDITFDDASVSNLTITEALNVTSSGISTFGGYVDINSSADISGTLNVTGISTLGGYVDINNSVDLGGSLNVTGISTLIGYVDINSSADISGTLNVGGATTLSGYVDINNSVDLGGSLNVTGVTTTNGLNVIGHGEFDDINVSGVATISQLDVQSDFDVYAPSTFYNNVTIDGNLIVNGTETIINTQTLFVNDKDIVLGIGTTPGNETDASANHGGVAVASTEGSPLVSFVSPGINTFPDTYKQIMWVAGETFGVGTTDAWLFNYAVGVGSTQVPDGVRFAASAIQFTDDTINTPNINVSDTSILDGVKIATGIVTASSGIVTYYGDGQYLQNVISFTGIGINSEGVSVGSGVTVIDFRGAGISTVTVGSGIGTIFVEGGGSGTVSISSIAPLSPENGDLWYSIDYGRTFVYYDEVTLGIGSTAVWVDASPFNLGLLDIGNLSVSNLTVTNTTNLLGITTISSLNVIGPTTLTTLDVGGINSSGIVTVSSLNVTGSTTLTTLDVGGINSSGIVTAVDFNSTSDQNLKTNINTIDNSLEIINQLRGVSFNWKEDNRGSYGVIAQELEQVLPELVSNNEIKTVNYNGIIGFLIEAVKELSAQVEELKNNK